MQNKKSFQRYGRGVYKCVICKRSTREAGQGNDQLCPECWDFAGQENCVFDGCADEWTVKEREALLKKAVKQGSDEALIRKNFAELFAFVPEPTDTDGPPAAAPAWSGFDSPECDDNPE